MQDMFRINTKVQAALEKLFQQHRLVFWYDEKAEMTDLFNSLQVPEVEKLIISNNEFTLKYNILIQQPDQRFLLYQAKPKPVDNENWLLDLLLSNYEFHTEASSLYLQDLELPSEFKSLVVEHETFFANEKRMNDLKAMLEPGDMESKIRLKMLSVLCASEPEWEKVLYALFAEVLKGKQDKFKAIEKFGLTPFLWGTIERKYNYKSIAPSIKDFLLQLIQDNLQRTLPEFKGTLNKEAYIFVNRWKENTKAKQLFADWSRQLEPALGIEALLHEIEIEALLDSDTYAVIDKKIILGIRQHIMSNTLPNHTIQEWIEKRRVKFFFSEFEKIYSALGYAAALLDEIRKMNQGIQNIENGKDGFEKYQKQWYLIDRLYRKYIFSSEKAEHQEILKVLTEQIEKAYSNTFLINLGNTWQKTLNGFKDWKIDGVIRQRDFYSKWVKPYIESENRIFIIVSDALRYESATELRERIIQEDRYTASISAMMGSLPTYTQLGMASLLPHASLTFDEHSEIVYADGISTQGTPNRTKVLQNAHEGSVAISADDFLKMKAQAEGREFIKPFNVIYIYSNHIDKIGDDKVSENKVFEATETEFDYILKIIKHINNMNGYNMIVTADHGYIYQHNRLEETDFTEFTPGGDIYKSSRRFVLGRNLDVNASVQHWNAAALGFGDDTEALIPKSINRLRVQGAGSRFVHGGASLQEIVIPVLEINKTRKSDVELVEVDIISGSSNITSNNFAVNFYQKQPVAEKIVPRLIRAGFYTKDNLLISDIISMLFNYTDKDAMAREKRQGFVFTVNASKYNGQDVYLRLEDQVEGTNQFKAYKSFTYRMLISFNNEFDDF